MLIAVDVATLGPTSFLVIHASRPMHDAKFYLNWDLGPGVSPVITDFWKGYVDGPLWIDPPEGAVGVRLTAQEANFAPLYAHIDSINDVIDQQQRAGLLECAPAVVAAPPADPVIRELRQVAAAITRLSRRPGPVARPKRKVWWKPWA